MGEWSPPGGLQGGGVYGEYKKKVPEKISKKIIFGPNRVINPLVHEFKKKFFCYRKKIFLRKKNSALQGGVVPQGGDCRRV